MALSQRERYIAIAVGAAFGVFALDRLVLSPYLQERERLASDKATAVKKQTDDRHVLKQQRTARQKWADLQAGGVQSDPSEMERQMQHWLNLWAREAGLSNLSLRADRTAAQQAGFIQVTVHATGTGPMPAIAKLLWRMEGAPVPVRVNEVQLNPAREGSDQLQLQLNVSALCSATESEAPGGGGGPRLMASPLRVTGERL